LCFNPRARDERENRSLALLLAYPCFNPRARDEREKVLEKWDNDGIPVSIHALVMSAKQCSQHAHKTDQVSIHALVMSANPHIQDFLFFVSCFNPRARDEREA